MRRRFDRRYCFIADLIETITIAGSEILAGKQKNSGRGQRELKASVKNARGRTVSQVKWLQRQLNDPYVKRAKAEGYRAVSYTHLRAHETS